MGEILIQIFLELGNGKNMLGILPRDLQKIIASYLLVNPLFILDAYSYSTRENIDNKYLTGLLSCNKETIKCLWLKYISDKLPDNYNEISFENFLEQYQTIIKYYQFFYRHSLGDIQKYNIFDKNTKIVKFLIEKMKNNITIKEKDLIKLVYIDQIYLDNTILMASVIHKQKESAKLLIKHGANLNIKNSNGYDALLIATEFYDYEYVKLLVDNGADIKTKNQNNFNLLILVSLRNSPDTITEAKYFIDKGINVNDFTNQGKTALTFACTTRNLELVKLLVENGANINATDFEGFTALMHVVYYNENYGDDKSNIIYYMINNGADFNIRNNYNKTVLDYAIDNNMSQSVKLLMDHGADYQSFFTQSN